MNIDKISFSAIDLYLKCSQAFYHKYVIKSDAVPIFDESLLLGSLAHSFIETRLSGLDIYTCFRDIVILWLEGSCKAILDADLLYDYARLVYPLLYRCSPWYQGEFPIRNKDKTIPKDPLNYPPVEFKEAFEEDNLSQLRYEIDCLATQINPKLSTLSIANIVAEAFFLAQFPLPSWFHRTVAVEYPLKETDFDLSWVGFIDWVVETKNGKLAIIDHKTSSRMLSDADVLWHPQLLMYAYFYSKQTGVIVDFIGINHLRSGEIKLAEIDMTIMSTVYDFYKDTVTAMKEAKPLRRYPTEYGSPCVGYNYKTGKVDKICPYLIHCWPDYMKDSKEFATEYEFL